MCYYLINGIHVLLGTCLLNYSISLRKLKNKYFVAALGVVRKNVEPAFKVLQYCSTPILKSEILTNSKPANRIPANLK